MTEQQTDQPDRPVTVPNVSPHAKSGISHEVIGSAAQTAYDDEYGAPEPSTDEGQQDAVASAELDTATREEQLAWVAAGETPEEKSQRADVVFTRLDRDPETTDEQRVELGQQLHAAVYPETADGTDTKDGTPEQTEPDGTPVEGTEATMEQTPGEAVNDQTGQVTAPGEPLPPTETDGSTPQPGADEDGFGGDAPTPAAQPDGSTEPHAPQQGQEDSTAQ